MTTPTPFTLSPEFVARQIRWFFTGMIVLEILFPGLFIVAGVLLLALGTSVDLRSVGFALLLPGLALGGGAVIRLLGIFPARADNSVPLLKRARRLAMFGLGAGILLAIVAIIVIAFTPWVTEIGGIVGVGAFIFAIFVTVLDSLVGFLGERTALRSTAS